METLRYILILDKSTQYLMHMPVRSPTLFHLDLLSQHDRFHSTINTTDTTTQLFLQPVCRMAGLVCPEGGAY